MAKYYTIAVFLMLPFTQILKAGNFGEHKLIGDSAFKEYCVTHPDFAALLGQLLESRPLDLSSDSLLIPLTKIDTGFFYQRRRYAGQYPLLIFNGKAVTYGDLTALSGDHSPDFLETFRRFTDDTLFKPSGLFLKLFDDVLCEYDKELRNLNSGGRGYNPVVYEFIRLSIKDKSHFHIPAKSLRQEIDTIGLRAYDSANELFYSGLIGDSFALLNRQKILNYFQSNSIAKYSILHIMAKTYYIHVLDAVDKMGESRERALQYLQMLDETAIQKSLGKRYLLETERINEYRELAKRFLLLTLFTNAFSEHYLQDMFASGHFFADRYARRDPFALEAKGIHDFFGRHGIATFIDGKAITLYGDGKYTSEQLEMAVAANIASLEDLTDVDIKQPRKPAVDYLLMLRSPTEEPYVLFPALKKIPNPPLGSRFSLQRENIGRSLSGFNYGLFGVGLNRSLGGGIMVGINYLLATPENRSCLLEDSIGFGFNFLLEISSDKNNSSTQQTTNARLGFGLNTLVMDWIYTNASLISTLPFRLAGKYELGIQIKPLRWNYGIHVGIVEYSSHITPYTQLSIGIIHY